MTEQHPITPPSELVQQWEADWHCSGNTNGNGFTYFVAIRAAQWGADQELEACCTWVGGGKRENLGEVLSLRATRRPKPPSLKQQALEELENMVKAAKDFGFGGTDPTAIRRVLEQLDD
jgi:hypothetical protein